MTEKTKIVLKRFARSTAALFVGTAAAWAVGPDALSVVPDQYDNMLVLIVGPALLALDKWLRFGSDKGEGDTPRA